MPFPQHSTGDICEAILVENLLRRGWYVYRPVSAYGPVDVIAISPGGKTYLFDAKADRFRVNPDRRKRARIHRKRSLLQKILHVRIAYVNETTRAVWFVPAL